MSRAIIGKTLRDNWWLILVVLAGIIVVEISIVRSVGGIDDRLGNSLLQQPWIKNVLRLLLGGELAENLNSTGVMTLGFSNTPLYVLTWVLLLVYCTRYLVGEIDRGTADLLLSLPVSRFSHYLSVTVLWVLAGPLICLTPLAGIAIGNQYFTLRDPLNYWSLGKICANLMALYFSVGCMTMLVATLTNRRGVAIGLVVAGLLGSVLINFLLIFAEDIMKHVAFLGILYYYRPLPIVSTGAWPIRNMAILAGVGVICWVIGALRFSRRDIPAA